MVAREPSGDPRHRHPQIDRQLTRPRVWKHSRLINITKAVGVPGGLSLLGHSSKRLAYNSQQGTAASCGLRRPAGKTEKQAKGRPTGRPFLRSTFRQISSGQCGVLLSCKHLGQRRQDCALNRGTDSAQTLHQPNLVDRSQLVEDDLPLLPLEAACHSSRIVAALGRHRSDDHRGEVSVGLVGRDNQARASFLISLPSVGSRATK